MISVLQEAGHIKSTVVLIFPRIHSVFTSDVCWSSLGTSIFEKSGSAVNNTRSRPPPKLSFRILWLWINITNVALESMWSWYWFTMRFPKGKLYYYALVHIPIKISVTIKHSTFLRTRCVFLKSSCGLPCLSIYYMSANIIKAHSLYLMKIYLAVFVY